MTTLNFWGFNTTISEACCNSGCPYVGYLHGNGVDVALEYAWECDLREYGNAKNVVNRDEDRYRCAKDHLGYSAEVRVRVRVIERYGEGCG